MTQEFYDEAYFKGGVKAKDYTPEHPYDWEHRHPIITATINDIRAFCLPFKTVLDVGCATGLLVRGLLSNGYDAKGIDISNWAIEHTDEKARGYTALGDIRQIHAAKASFDLVTCMDTLEHLCKDDIMTALLELTRVSSREVIIRVPCALPEDSGSTVADLATVTGDVSHRYIVPEEEWESNIAIVGWTCVGIVRGVDLHFLPRSRYLIIRSPTSLDLGRDNANNK